MEAIVNKTWLLIASALIVIISGILIGLEFINHINANVLVVNPVLRISLKITLLLSGSLILAALVYDKRRSTASKDKIKTEDKLEVEQALRGIGQLIWTWQIEEDKLEVDEKWSHAFGYQGPIDNWKKLIHPEDRQLVEHALAQHLVSNNDYYKLEHRLKTKPGNWKWVLAQGKVVQRNENGKAVKMIGIHKDISQSKIKEERLKKSEQRYRALFENTGVAMAIVDQNMQILLINQQAKDFLGHDWAAPGSKLPLEEVVAEENGVDKILKYNRLRQKGEAPNKYEIKFKDAQDQTKVALLKVSLLSDGQKRIVSAIDITKRKEVEEKIKYMNYHDNLTGLYNRKYHQNKLRELDQAQYYPLSIIMGDNNGLKLINDTFGHTKGDHLIQETAKILKKVSRKQDVVARWGGDEFVILAPNTSREEAEKLIAEINQCCQESDFQPIIPNISLGTAFKNKVEEDIERIIKLAEDRMYSKKMESKKNIEGSMMQSLEQSLLEMDYELQGHTERVEELALDVGYKLGLSQEQLNNLELLARLHDIGKLAISNNLLAASNSLSQEEAEKLNQHPKIGYRVVKNFQRLTPIANSVLHHHENWDGSGYPDGLEQEEIPFLARIVRVVDAYDVMTNSKRKAKTDLSPSEAIQVIEEQQGVEFDPDVVTAFVDLTENKTVI